MADARRGADAKPVRKDAEIKRLAKFYAVDRPPRKRLRTLLDFLKNPGGGAGADGSLAGTVQQLLTGAPKDAGNAADNSAILIDFWSDLNNPSMLFDVLSDCVTELETLYVPQEHGFRRRKKTLEAEDWNEVFEGLEVLIRNNIPLIHEGWKNHGFTLLFSKLLKRDNHALIKKYAFRCLALYADATRNTQQLTAPSLAGGSAQLLSADGDCGTEDDESIRGTTILSANRRSTLHLELLRESVDFSPYGGGSILLPDKFINQGVHVEGWIRAMPTQAEEPVDMLKFIMDLSLEREDPKIVTNPKINHKARGDRFEYWAELIMRFYMPLLYPKVCIKVKVKEEGDNTGFFHHCPGSFQRVVARWIYKLRSKPECMETLWSKREFAEVIMETVRQRFAYRDNELVLDAIKFYSGICTNGQYVPLGMQSQIHETLRAMISHVSQLFHPSVQLDDPKILLNCIELLELISQRPLDDYTSTYLRKFVISTLDNCVTLRDPGNGPILTAMVSVVIHVWMHAAVVSKGAGPQVWLELTIAIRRWLVAPNDAKSISLEVINCWKRELRLASCLLMHLMDEGQSILKVTPEGAVILPQGSDPTGKDSSAKQGYVQSSATFLTSTVQDIGDATVLLDRVLHLVPPPTVSSLSPMLHLQLIEGLLQLVQLWIDSAICSQRAMPTALHRISPSTLIALFGEWFLPVCELDNIEYVNSRCVAIVILCKLCAVRSANPLTRGHLTVLSRVLYKGITSPFGVVVSTVLQRAASIFTLNLEGMNVLVPAFLHTVDRIIIQNIWERAEQSKVKSSEWNRELNAALDIILSILALPKRYRGQDFVNWQRKLVNTLSVGADVNLDRLHELMEEIPDSDEQFHVIAGRVLMRIASLPFTDIVTIKKRALWGLYTLVVMHLSPNTSALVKRSDLADWIMKLLDFCYALDFSISITALSILQDLAEHHEDIHSLDPLLIARIVMTLAVFAQQQVEEASIEVQAAVEAMGASTGSGESSVVGGEDLSNASSGRISANRRGSDMDSADGSHKIKPGTSLKPINTALGTPKTEPDNSNPKEREIPALRLIVQKTGAIFECLRFWVMHRPQVLHDNDVKKILFSSIEAALVGSLPDGEWQREVERARAQARRMSMPLLFLGLQMRASLDNDASQAWLKCFEETSLAAEGLVMHLLHHVNGFPSPAGVDQMTSTCSELRDGDESSPYSSNNEQSQDPSTPASISFVYMNSMVFTVVGSVDSPCARFIARDMTGLFTWEMTPALASASSSAMRKSKRALTTGSDGGVGPERELLVADDGGNARGLEHSLFHRVDATVRVEVKVSFSETAKAGNALCHVCGGEKPRPNEGSADSNAPKLELLRIPRAREQAMLTNSVCTSKGNYSFHDDGDITANGGSNANGDKKKLAPRSSPDGDKMPVSGGGNRDERQERLERVAKMHEERNNTSAAVTEVVTSTSVSLKQCDCEHRSGRGNVLSICGLFEMDEREANIGSLDEERCLLDLVLDGIPMVFRDCGGDTTDKTILGGRYAMNKYNLMDMEHSTNPLVKDSSELAGFSFLQRLIHDEECYAQMKAFLVKDGDAEGKELIEFCDAVKKYERLMIPSERLGQACTIFWEFLSGDGGRHVQFPSSVATAVQNQIQTAQKALKFGQIDQWCLPGTLFQQAASHLECEYFENSGLLDRFVSSLDQPPSTNGQDGNKDSANQQPVATPIPPQLGLFDGFSIMELNARISHLALTYRSAEKQFAAGSVQDASTHHVEESLGMRVSALDICRLFLSQVGLLPGATSDLQMRRRIKLLENGAKLERSLKHLDKSPTRETMKIGVIYVGPKQRTQQDLLKNERGSAAYDRFISRLGWDVTLLNHRGFTGGLDCNPKSLSNGTTSLYYANAHSEVMFHVVTKMPTKPADPQQIDKKRHVGNDYVHIVWNDNDAQAYDPTTITSHFNDVQIVIHPLRRSQRGLYFVRIHSKDKVPPFGPIQSGMVIHEDDLAPLVRQTAMNANRVCRSQTTVYVRPYPTRKKLVDEIVERYATEYQESQLLTMLFSNGASTTSAHASAVPQNGVSVGM